MSEKQPMIRSKAQLGIILSKMEKFSGPKVRLEQYPTPPEIAAEVLWMAHMRQNMAKSETLDLGCGAGILGIGALLLGSKKVTFIDIDKNMLKLTENNIKWAKSEGYLDPKLAQETHYELICEDISGNKGDSEGIREKSRRKEKYDIVLQNPPFGTKTRNIDKIFLEKAISWGKTIYSMHKSSTEKHLIGFVEKKGGEVRDILRFRFPIKKAFGFHRKPKKIIDVSCLVIVADGAGQAAGKGGE